MSAENKFLPLLGRAMIGAPFMLSGVGKIAAFAGTAGYIASVGLPLAPAVAAATSSRTSCWPAACCRSSISAPDR